MGELGLQVLRSLAELAVWRSPGARPGEGASGPCTGGAASVSQAFGRGELSFSKVRALTRVATPRNEPELVELARHATASHLEKLVRAYRGTLRVAELEEANRRHEGRYLSWSYEDDGSVVIRTQLPPEDGALVLAALQQARDALQDVSAETSSSGNPMPTRWWPWPRLSSHTAPLHARAAIATKSLST